MTLASAPDPANLLELLAAEQVLMEQFERKFPDIVSVGAAAHKCLVEQIAGRPGLGFPVDHGVVMALIGAFVVRSFDTGLGCCLRARSWESLPFQRQMVEGVCYLATVAHEGSPAAEAWLMKGADGVDWHDFQTMFDRKKGHGAKWRYRHLTDERREYFESHYGFASDSTHVNLKRGPSVGRFSDDGVAAVYLHDNDMEHRARVALSIVDLAAKSALEVNRHWRHYSPDRAHDDGVRSLWAQRTALVGDYQKRFGMHA